MNLLILMLLLLTVAAEVHSEGEDLAPVEIGDAFVLLVCPLKSDSVKWVHGTKEITGNQSSTYKIMAEDGTAKGFYSCESNKKKHYFFIKARVCENCFELSGLTAAGVIFGDLLFTGGVILIVYIWTQRKKDPVSNAPRPPNPDYEALNPKTQNRDVYAGIK
ncbi:hypothetical protein E1301_Tti024183 [Triplophysa tibetana]|uniref:CD3 gamma/delta subunit Ig-like domain-containing protein n=1 Tax=Triplophysa tibetana TaxID=1572043 RepID=A0A5A9MVI4_9TELE|nr:hypothetical protein E1301_Tti024183 [Triplophysa tibetana]